VTAISEHPELWRLRSVGYGSAQLQAAGAAAAMRKTGRVEKAFPRAPDAMMAHQEAAAGVVARTEEVGGTTGVKAGTSMKEGGDGGSNWAAMRQWDCSIKQLAGSPSPDACTSRFTNC
jgi:hypothetical protein